MSTYRVEVTGTSREIYLVEDATSPQDAMDRWHEGTLILSENSDGEPQSARLEDE